MWDFFGYAKNVWNFLGRQILKLVFLGCKIWTSVSPPPLPPVIKISEWSPWGYHSEGIIWNIYTALQLVTVKPLHIDVFVSLYFREWTFRTSQPAGPTDSLFARCYITLFRTKSITRPLTPTTDEQTGRLPSTWLGKNPVGISNKAHGRSGEL